MSASTSPKVAKKKKAGSALIVDPATMLTGNDPAELRQLTWRRPPSAINEKLLAAVEYKPLEEKDLFGLKISTRALKNLAPSEIRDLYEVFQTFDRNENGLVFQRFEKFLFCLSY